MQRSGTAGCSEYLSLLELIDLVELGGQELLERLLIILVPVSAVRTALELLLEAAIVDIVGLPCSIQVVLEVGRRPLVRNLG